MELGNNKFVLFYSIKLVVICYTSHRDLIHIVSVLFVTNNMNLTY